uniref:HNH endonuclease n=1 Tax=Mediterraneibacter glycyrrhizinilyticus TaxID=342942 RepID=UPI0013DE6288
MYSPERQFETDNISVHHIVPIAEDWERRLDDENLITLCSKHHEMAERGEIKRKKLLSIAKEQERKRDCPVCG